MLKKPHLPDEEKEKSELLLPEPKKAVIVPPAVSERTSIFEFFTIFSLVGRFTGRVDYNTSQVGAYNTSQVGAYNNSQLVAYNTHHSLILARHRPL